jgi:hypothetical protein
VLSDHFISVETRYGYEVRVSGAVAITSKIYALKFGSIEPSVSTDDPTERGRLSKERKRLHVQFFPKDGRGPWAGSPREWLERGLVALNWKKGRHN